jgi:hypothetical protein
MELLPENLEREKKIYVSIHPPSPARVKLTTGSKKAAAYGWISINYLELRVKITSYHFSVTFIK